MTKHPKFLPKSWTQWLFYFFAGWGVGNVFVEIASIFFEGWAVSVVASVLIVALLFVVFQFGFREIDSERDF